jgi:membrane-associated protein
MNIIQFILDFIIHMDDKLALIIDQFGIFTYVILFIVLFCETGLVVTPFLPGDSLLFAAGSLAALGSANTQFSINIHLMWLLMAIAAILGDTVNYWIGHYIGPKVFSIKSRWLKKEYLDRTHAFYEKHGGKTILLARFIPIIRTFAPFVAGVGRMSYGYFITYNLVGGVLWTAIFLYAGYFFGNVPFVKDNFSLVIFAIIFISVIPAVIEAVKAHQESKHATSAAEAAKVETEG